MLGSLERTSALVALVRDQGTSLYPLGLAAGTQETHIAWGHRMVRLQRVEERQLGCGSVRNPVVQDLGFSHQELTFLEKIAIALRTCRELWGEM